MTVLDLQSCIAKSWSPTIGDPNFTGWFTVLTYSATAILSLLVFFRITDTKSRLFWLILSFSLLMLAINKQLDLQSAITVAGKCLAYAQGWYDNRRLVQGWFIFILVITALIMVLLAVSLLKNSLFNNGLALIGIAIVSLFVIIRATSIHNFDFFIGQSIFWLPNNFILENIGLFFISINAFHILRKGESSN